MFLILLIAAIVPQPNGVLVDHCAEVEINHYFSESGDVVFDQIIFRRDDRRIDAWRLIKQPHQIPARDWNAGGFTATWFDADNLRRVHCDQLQHTWTHAGFAGDPELNERDAFPKEQRPDLKRP